MRYPYDPKGQRIQVEGGILNRAFLGHFQVSAADAVAASADGVLVAALTAEKQEITEGIASPAVPRSPSAVANAAGVTGNVVITGKNAIGEVIEETLALNGKTAKNGAKAFASFDKIELPVQAHASAQQVETATVVAAVTGAGDAAVTVTSKLFDANVVLAVPVEAEDDSSAVAAAIRTAMEADPDISEHFDVSGENAAVVLTAKVPAANDDTLNIAIATDTATGITAAPTSTATTPGAAPDIVSVGWGDKLGLPCKLAKNSVLGAFLDNAREENTPTVAVDADHLEGNTVLLGSALNGKVVDVYLIV